jgi:Phage integrase, N-terminal SAM-like domain
MKHTGAVIPKLIERFFTAQLMRQQNVSPHTIASYRDTFRLLLAFAHKKLHKPPPSLDLRDIDAPLVSLFLDNIEQRRSPFVRARNLRLTAIRSVNKAHARLSSFGNDRKLFCDVEATVRICDACRIINRCLKRDSHYDDLHRLRNRERHRTHQNP